MPQRPWFRSRRIGWGLTPVSWQGWALTIGFVVVDVVLAFTLAARQPWLFFTLFGIALALYMFIALMTRAGR